ncbi:hypothetical protein [Rhizobium sp.]|uniref:hypothetical protein n=1 Tax=Rhizobium sp. TaxID=391 RepID=UPI002AA83AEB
MLDLDCPVCIATAIVSSGFSIMLFARLLASAMVISLACPAFAADTASPQFGTVKGRCLDLSIGTQEFSAACAEQLGRSLHNDGRTGLFFFVGPTHIMTFSGRALKDTSRDKTKLETITIDQVVLNDGTGSKTAVQTLPADGNCSTTQKSDTVFLVSCSGKLQKGTKFSASFEIDKSL